MLLLTAKHEQASALFLACDWTHAHILHRSCQRTRAREKTKSSEDTSAWNLETDALRSDEGEHSHAVILSYIRVASSRSVHWQDLQLLRGFRVSLLCAILPSSEAPRSMGTCSCRWNCSKVCFSGCIEARPLCCFAGLWSVLVRGFVQSHWPWGDCKDGWWDEPGAWRSLFFYKTLRCRSSHLLMWWGSWVQHYHGHTANAELDNPKHPLRSNSNWLLCRFPNSAMSLKSLLPPTFFGGNEADHKGP